MPFTMTRRRMLFTKHQPPRQLSSLYVHTYTSMETLQEMERAGRIKTTSARPSQNTKFMCLLKNLSSWISLFLNQDKAPTHHDHLFSLLSPTQCPAEPSEAVLLGVGLGQMVQDRVNTQWLFANWLRLNYIRHPWNWWRCLQLSV